MDETHGRKRSGHRSDPAATQRRKRGDDRLPEVLRVPPAAPAADYWYLAQTQKVTPDFGYKKEDIFISASAVPAPAGMTTDDRFHLIDGRAPTLSHGSGAWP